MTDHQKVLATITNTEGNWASTITIGNQDYPLNAKDRSGLYMSIIKRATEVAKNGQKNVLAHISDYPQNKLEVVTVTPDGVVEHEDTKPLVALPTPTATAPEAPEVSAPEPITELPPMTPSHPSAEQFVATLDSPGPAAPVQAEADPLPSRADVRFVKPVRERPRSGMRSAVYTLTGGAVNMGLSSREKVEEDLIRRIARPIRGTHNTAFLSLKGGIGKTSTTVGVGMILAEYRGDPPCAADLNPDAGDLAERALGEALYENASPRTVSDIVRAVDKIDSLTTLSEYMHHANRLHVIAGEQDPALSDALNAGDYFKIQRLVAQYYKIMLTDCGTGVSHPAMSGILLTADNLVIASGYAVSGAKRAKSTLDWLTAHGYENLARNAVVVVTDKEMVSARVDRRAIEDTLAGVAKTLVVVPHDKGVADGDQISLERISRETRLAYMQIAAAIVDGYN